MDLAETTAQRTAMAALVLQDITIHKVGGLSVEALTETTEEALPISMASGKELLLGRLGKLMVICTLKVETPVFRIPPHLLRRLPTQEMAAELIRGVQ